MFLSTVVGTYQKLFGDRFSNLVTTPVVTKLLGQALKNRDNKV